MTDSERLDFIAKHKLEPRYADFRGVWVVGSYIRNGSYFHWGTHEDLRTAIDEAAKEMRGLNNGN